MLTDPSSVVESDRRAYTSAYARAGRMKAGFSYFAALEQDAQDNAKWAKGPKLSMPVLAMGGEHSARELVSAQFSQVATKVTPMVIQGSGHWLLEEKPAEVIPAVVNFLHTSSASSGFKVP